MAARLGFVLYIVGLCLGGLTALLGATLLIFGADVGKIVGGFFLVTGIAIVAVGRTSHFILADE